MNKVLITGGCSFTESKNYLENVSGNMTQTWALQLGKYLQNYGYKFINKALGSQGNGLISRSVLYQVTEELRTRAAEDLLVGVMWSGADRYDYRVTNPEYQDFIMEKVNNGWMENPTGFIPDVDKRWIILNHHWANPDDKGKLNKQADLYYRNFHDNVSSYIYSLEHMLRLQYFLKCNNIKYFFTIYQDHVFDPYSINHPEVNYLYKLLDKTQFLPVTSAYTWCVERRVDEKHWICPHPHNHPSSIHHKYFTEEVIIPWLENKNYIDITK